MTGAERDANSDFPGATGYQISDNAIDSNTRQCERQGGKNGRKQGKATRHGSLKDDKAVFQIHNPEVGKKIPVECLDGALDGRQPALAAALNPQQKIRHLESGRHRMSLRQVDVRRIYPGEISEANVLHDSD